MEEIAETRDISHGSVSVILHDHLGIHMLTIHWVPKSLSDKQMATKTSVNSGLLLKQFKLLKGMEFHHENMPI